MRVTMRAAGVIRGRVVDDKTGKPLSPFMVRVTSSPDRGRTIRPAAERGERRYGGEKFATPTARFASASSCGTCPCR